MAGLEWTINNSFLWLCFLHASFYIIFYFLSDGEEKLNEFFKYLNELQPKVKFTMEKSINKIAFLDVTVSKNKNKLSTDLYAKETDTH